MAEKMPKGHSVTLTAHGDGTYHTQEMGDQGMFRREDGKTPGRTEHASFGHAIMHIAKHHGPEGEHMHIHGHEDGFTTHHVPEDGDVEGPDEHPSMRALKAHVGDCMEAE